jgi:hypothetical protein
MPIRINLLAELQSAEEERRKDPVKRTMIVAAVVVGAVALWTASLQVKVMASKREVTNLQTKWKSIEKNYEAAVAAKRRNLETEDRLVALRSMSTNRFLWGNTLGAFSQTLNNIEDVQVLRMRVEQTYTQAAATPNRTNGTTVVRGKPATSTEKIHLTIDAMDSSAQAGARVTAFKNAIGAQPYFQHNLAKTNGLMLTSQSPPQINQGSGNQFVMFQIQCAFPEKVR